MHKENGTKFISEEAKRIDNTVDKILINVCEQFNTAIRAERGLSDALISGSEAELDRLHEIRKEILAPVVRAYTTLYETHERILRENGCTLEDNYFTPKTKASLKTKSGSDRLDSYLAELDENNDFTRRLRDRLEQDHADYEEVMEAAGLLEVE